MLEDLEVEVMATDPLPVRADARSDAGVRTPLRIAPRDASGEIAIYMAGERWLIREFNPERRLSATHLLPKKMTGGHQHSSTLLPLPRTPEIGR